MLADEVTNNNILGLRSGERLPVISNIYTLSPISTYYFTIGELQPDLQQDPRHLRRAGLQRGRSVRPQRLQVYTKSYIDVVDNYLLIYFLHICLYQDLLQEPHDQGQCDQPWRVPVGGRHLRQVGKGSVQVSLRLLST